MLNFDQTFWMTVGVQVILVILAGASIFTLFYREQFRRIEKLRYKAELSRTRESFERRIYKLSHELELSKDRWVELNHLLLSAQGIIGHARNLSQEESFFESMGIDLSTLGQDTELVFVLMPFHKDYESIYEALSVTIGTMGLRCERGDEDYIRGDILPHILRKLVSAGTILALIDGRNPNVFYELGLAHALNKDVILISHDESLSAGEVPIDLKSNRILFYKDVQDLTDKLPNELIKATNK